mmetsp:Transcript_65585/g.128720  ORF Transcript_65585/g.128720 Transcript_65585/m.128720 type:complete len:431 (+) Transcript_65585:137-1429(+)
MNEPRSKRKMDCDSVFEESFVSVKKHKKDRKNKREIVSVLKDDVVDATKKEEVAMKANAAALKRETSENSNTKMKKRRNKKAGEKKKNTVALSKAEGGATSEVSSVRVSNNDAVSTIIASFSNPGTGNLSDRLNPDHPCFDSELKGQWKTLLKKERSLVVAADLAALESVRLSGQATAAALPFVAESDDHCESPPEAYADIAAPVLDLIASSLGKTRKSLEIYDPYFCSGAMKRHLCALGFERVHNECVDFYDVLARGALPPHDVVVTNPPYSQDHVERLLSFVGKHDKPYLLLMPNYVCAKPYFLPRLLGHSNDGASAYTGFRTIAPMYVCPYKRYHYWTPKAMRPGGKTQGHANATLGNRTSPFISFWYVDTEPLISRKRFLRHCSKLPPTIPAAPVLSVATATRASESRPLPMFCSEISHLPSSIRP